MFLANVVGEAFFGKEFIQYLKTNHRWSVSILRNEKAPLSKKNITFTELMNDTDLHTYINGTRMDLSFKDDGLSRVIYNGNFIQSKTEWVARGIAHELLRCLTLYICQDDNKTPDELRNRFMQMNHHLLAGTDIGWTLLE